MSHALVRLLACLLLSGPAWAQPDPQPVEGGVLVPPAEQVDGEPAELHWSQVRVLEQVQPTYPKAAKALEISEASCRVRVYIDTAGHPTALDFEACPTVFRPATEAAVMQWRFSPATDEAGEPTAAQFVIAVKYVMPGARNPPPEPPPDPESLAFFELSELVIRKRVFPDMPDEVRERGGSWACEALLIVGSDGRVRTVQPEDCDDIVRREAVEAFMRWRFKPVRDQDGQPTSFATRARSTFEVR